MNEVEVIMKTDIVAEKGYEYYTVRDPLSKKLTLCRKRYDTKPYRERFKEVPKQEVKQEEVAQ
jgi:hypothetical protein